MTAVVQNAPSICFVGLRNLPMLAREFGSLGAGGAELQQTLLARALARRGFRVSMVVADCGQSDGATFDGIKTYKAFRPEEGIPVVRFLHPRWTKVWKALQRANADIYYTSCAGALVGQVALFARLRARKVVFRIASDTDCDPNSLLVRFWRDKRLYQYGLRRADLVLAQTPHQQQALASNFGRVSRVVDSLTDSRGSRGSFAERDIDVLWVGNIRQLKRPDLLFQLARRLPALRFHMAGGPMPGAEELFDAVKAEAAAIDNLTFHGPVPYQAIGELFARARVLAGTSQIEGFPNTYLQAWAHGVPVVAFLDPQRLLSRQALGEAVTDLDSMTHAVAGLCGNPESWEAVSLRCRQYMETRCNESQMLTPYIEALTRLHAAPHSAAPGLREA
jgi:glycosyltransferase involved in cell wall biosynthesis